MPGARDPADDLDLSFQHLGSPTALYSGSEALSGLSREVRRLGCGSTLLLTTPSCARLGLPDHILAAVDVDATVFARVERESPRSSVDAAVDVALRTGSDLLIGVGGGSAAVTTRAVTILLRKRGRDARNILVPTTPTTAISRAGAAVVDKHARLELFDLGARAAAVILDTFILATTPVALYRTAAAASFCSAAEILTVPSLSPVAYVDCATAVTTLAKALAIIADQPEDRTARLRAAVGAFLTGRSGDSMPGVSPGVMHALAHQFQIRHHIEQGLAMGALLKSSLSYDLERTPAVEARLSRALGVRARGRLKAVEILARAGLPVRLRDLRVPRDGLPGIAEQSMTSFFATHAYRPPCGPAELVEILERAW